MLPPKLTVINETEDQKKLIQNRKEVLVNLTTRIREMNRADDHPTIRLLTLVFTLGASEPGKLRMLRVYDTDSSRNLRPTDIWFNGATARVQPIYKKVYIR